MSYVVREDVGTTRRRSLSGHQRLQAWERTRGVCVVCERAIDGVHDRWIVEHIRALELGGEDDLANMGPAHEACGREKTRDDHAATAQAKRRKIRHIGADDVRHPLPGSRTGPLKRKVDGTVVRRGDSSRIHHEMQGKPSATWDSRENPAYQPVLVGTESPERHCLLPDPATRPNEGDMTTAVVNTTTVGRTASPAGPTADAAILGDALPNVPAHLAFIFDRPLGQTHEADASYDTLRRSFLRDLKPKTTIEAIWTKDIIHYTWEAQQLRLCRDLILKQAEAEAVCDLIAPSLREADPMGLRAFEKPTADALATGWVTGKAEEKARVDAILADRGLTAGNVRAQAFYKRLSTMDALNQMIQAAEQRRDGFLRELERKRSSYAQTLRATAEDIIDVEL